MSAPRIAAVMCTLNEEDIVGATARHALTQGIEHLYVLDQSTDGTREVLKAIGRETRFLGRVTLVTSDDPVFHQAAHTNYLAALAAGRGAEWILPLDADEWWVPTAHPTIADAVADVKRPAVLAVPVYQHLDWNRRVKGPTSFKCLASWAEGMQFLMGAHDVYHPGKPDKSTLQIREVSFRGPDHFVRKCRDRIRTLDRAHPDATMGQHMRDREKLSDEELRAEWRRRHASTDCVWDPIPSRYRVEVRS